jgi:hypothetical protein
MAKNTKLKKLQKLKLEYSGERRGYRDRQHEILAETMAIVIEIRRDKATAKAFSRLSEKVRPKGSQDSKSWITGAAVAYVTGAKSKNAIKIAWKRARVLNYLHDFHGISPKNIAVEIRERGGIEAIIRLAAEEDPLRPKSSSDDEKESDKKTGATLKSRGGSKSSTDYESSSADDDESGNKTKSSRGRGHTASDDHDTLRVSIDQCLRRKLLGLAVGKLGKLIGLRTDEDGHGTVFEVWKVAPIPSGLGKKIAKKKSKNN